MIHAMERTPEANGHHEYFLSADINLTQYGGPSVERIPIRSREDLLAAVPYLLGFHPQESTVVVGLHGQENSVGPILRYDMTSEQIGVAHHAIAVLQGIGCEGLVLIGYGADQEVTPVVDKMREAAANAQLTIKGALRVEGGRYWSYIDDGDTPFPPDGRPFDVDSNAVATKMALLGATALGGRSEFAKRLEPTEARVPDEIFDDVDNMLRALAAKSVRQAVEVGRQHVQACLRIAREGARLDDRQVAWLALP